MKNKSVFKCQRLGFTLAEVLITLGIIGVVAAMTLPALINNTKGAQNLTALKKAYSVLTNVIQIMTYEEGQAITPSAYGVHKFAPVFEKYLVKAKACTDNGYGTCLVDRNSILNDNGAAIGYDFIGYKTYNKKAAVAGNLMDNGQVLLSDGMALFIENEAVTYISVDINGINKGPNLWGHDLFTFQLMTSGKLLPMGSEGTTYSETELCSASSSSAFNGIACTNKALTDKDYWKNLP